MLKPDFNIEEVNKIIRGRRSMFIAQLKKMIRLMTQSSRNCWKTPIGHPLTNSPNLGDLLSTLVKV